MKKEQFETYKFTVNTEIVYFEDEQGVIWDKVTEVDFENGWVGIERGQIVKYSEIKQIRN